PDQRAPRVRGQQHDPAHVLGRQQPRRRADQARAAGLTQPRAAALVDAPSPLAGEGAFMSVAFAAHAGRSQANVAGNPFAPRCCEAYFSCNMITLAKKYTSSSAPLFRYFSTFASGKAKPLFPSYRTAVVAIVLPKDSNSFGSTCLAPS